MDDTNRKRVSLQSQNSNRLQKGNQPQAKQKNILQLKDELVKMKQFLNSEMPVLSKLVNSHRNHTDNHLQEKLTYSINNLPTQQIEQIVNKNRALMEQNQKLNLQLRKEKSLKKELNRSLRKQQQMLQNLYESTHRHLQNSQQTISTLSRKQSRQKSLNLKISEREFKNARNQKSSRDISQPRQKVSIWHGRKQSMTNFDKFATQTSIQNNISHQKQQAGPFKLSPCQYSSSEEETILIIKQVNMLEHKMKDLMRESHKTDNRTKKLQIRNELEKISNKINWLKNCLARN